MKKKTKNYLLLLSALFLLLAIPFPVMAESTVDSETFVASGFYYQHDPRLNPKAMEDIIVDPTAVYGFSPSPNGRLSAYAAYDWSSPEMVNGEHGRLERIAYHESLQEMYTLLDKMTAENRSTEDIARAVSSKRNELRMNAYEGDPEGLANLKKRNLEQYGHEEGPVPEELYEKYGSWETVIDKSFSANPGMDACLGLYDDYYDVYLAAGQISTEKQTAATREYTFASFVDSVRSFPSVPDARNLDEFADADQISAWYRPELAASVSAGVLKGYEDNTIRPQNTISRIEAFVILSRCLPDLEKTDASLEFSDVPAWAQDEVDRLSGAGLIKGYGDGILGSNDLLTVEQTVILVGRLHEADRSPLSLWTQNARAKDELTSYIKEITDENSPDYIPVQDRIAVFDLDGTLFCETDPNYFDYTLLAYRVLDDPDYKEKASSFEREVAGKIVEQNTLGTSFPGLEVDHGKAVASAFAGMTVKEFNAYIQEFKKHAMPSYEGMTYGKAFYQPMVQVVNYLQANDFTVYIVSGTDRLIVRGIVDNSVLNIPNRQIIGSDETITASGQGEADGLDYVFKDSDELILGGSFIIKNLKMNKVSAIMQEIGQQPVLSFGNSTGDSSMAEYVTSNNAYKSLAFMLCCDDTDRENGNQSKADRMYSLCEEFDWIPVSMKNDWSTIYGKNVTYLGKTEIKNAA